MKKVLLTLLCISTLSAAFPAFAGPDWQLIEQGRKAKQTQLAQAANKAPQTGMDQQMDPKMHEKMNNMMKDCNMDMKNHQSGMGEKMDSKMNGKMDQMMKNCMADKDQNAAMSGTADQRKDLWEGSGIYAGH
jgi:hypothetical protein